MTSQFTHLLTKYPDIPDKLFLTLHFLLACRGSLWIVSRCSGTFCKIIHMCIKSTTHTPHSRYMYIIYMYSSYTVWYKIGLCTSLQKFQDKKDLPAIEDYGQSVIMQVFKQGRHWLNIIWNSYFNSWASSLKK